MTVYNLNNNVTGSQITDGSIAYSDIQNVSATSKVLGRISSGEGVIEEITFSQSATASSIAQRDSNGYLGVSQLTGSGAVGTTIDISSYGTNLTGGAITGTNQNASNSTFIAPKGTGTGSLGKFVFKAPVSGTSSGSTAHAVVIRLALNGSVTGMTSGVASTLATATMASGSMAGGAINYTVEASNGTDFQATSGRVCFAIRNKAGTTTGTASIIGTEVTSCSIGTLANAFSVTSSGQIQITPTVIGITATTLRVTYSIENFGQQSITLP